VCSLAGSCANSGRQVPAAIEAYIAAALAPPRKQAGPARVNRLGNKPSTNEDGKPRSPRVHWLRSGNGPAEEGSLNSRASGARGEQSWLSRPRRA
jgi:hypothetical protein